MKLHHIGLIIGWIALISVVFFAAFNEKKKSQDLGAPVSPNIPQVATLPSQKQIQDGTRSNSVSSDMQVIIEE